MTPRDIEKLKAIGYAADPVVGLPQVAGWVVIPPSGASFLSERGRVASESDAWEIAKAHAQSPEGMKATMADKVRFIESVDIRLHPKGMWLADDGPEGRGNLTGEGDSPEAAVDALFWKVP